MLSLHALVSIHVNFVISYFLGVRAWTPSVLYSNLGHEACSDSHKNKMFTCPNA
jgi:hypothetical protein